MIGFSNKTKWWVGIISLPIIAFTLWLYRRFDPLQYDFFPPCPFHFATGLHCPGCGSQRAFHALLHGDVLGALQYNFLLVLTFLVMLYKIYLLIRKKDKASTHVFNNNKTPWVILSCIICFWVLRNLPVYPFSLLSP